MNRLLKHEFKVMNQVLRPYLLIVVLTVMVAGIFRVLYGGTINFTYSATETGINFLVKTWSGMGIGVVSTALMVEVFSMPLLVLAYVIYNFSFDMNGRSANLFFTIPQKSEHILLSKMITGSLGVIIISTIFPLCLGLMDLWYSTDDFGLKNIILNPRLSFEYLTVFVVIAGYVLAVLLSMVYFSICLSKYIIRNKAWQWMGSIMFSVGVIFTDVVVTQYLDQHINISLNAVKLLSTEGQQIFGDIVQINLLTLGFEMLLTFVLVKGAAYLMAYKLDY